MKSESFEWCSIQEICINIHYFFKIPVFASIYVRGKKGENTEQ